MCRRANTAFLQEFCKLQKPLAIYPVAFARRRSGVRIPSTPLFACKLLPVERAQESKADALLHEQTRNRRRRGRNTPGCPVESQLCARVQDRAIWGCERPPEMSSLMPGTIGGAIPWAHYDNGRWRAGLRARSCQAESPRDGLAGLVPVRHLFDADGAWHLPPGCEPITPLISISGWGERSRLILMLNESASPTAS